MGRGPFTCGFCAKSIPTAQGLKSHITRLHKPAPDATGSLNGDLPDTSDEPPASHPASQPPGQPAGQTTPFVHLLANLRCTSNIARRVPKGARSAASEALSSTIDSCLSSNSEASWERLLLFSFGCFRLPKQSDRKTSLTTIVKQNISQFLQGASFPLQPPPKPKERQSPSEAFSRRVEVKLSEGDTRGALRLLCSEDGFAPPGPTTLEALRDKHPPPSLGPPNAPPQAPAHPHPIPTDAGIRGAIMSFPPGSAGGPDMLRPQHLKDLIGNHPTGPGGRLLTSIASLCTALLAGSVPDTIRPVLTGATLCALLKKDGGIRPIAIGNTWRRLTAKIGCAHIKNQLTSKLQPTQLGFGTAGGAEAAVHAARRFIASPSDQPTVLLKIDYLNAFNSLERRCILDNAAATFPSLFSFVSLCYSEPSHLIYGEEIIPSTRGVQQGDPLGPALFCSTVHPIADSMSSSLNIWYLDDSALGGKPDVVLHDFEQLTRLSLDLGLEVNYSKCELFVFGGSLQEKLEIQSRFSNLAPNILFPDGSACSLLGAPLAPEAIPSSLDKKTAALKRVSDRLSALKAHIAYFVLRNCLAIPKLSFLLRCTPAWTDPGGLTAFDAVLHQALENICNTHLDQNAWAQATLPVRRGGLGVKCASNLAIPAFLASVHGAQDLVGAILPPSLRQTTDPYLEEGLLLWMELSPGRSATPLPPLPARHLQKTWEVPGQDQLVSRLHDQAISLSNKARLISVDSPESGAFLNVLPSAPLGTLLPDHVFRIATALRLGSTLCQEHTCICGSIVHPVGTHGLSCIKASGRRSRHAEVNDILRRGLMSAGLPTVLEPANLSTSNGSRPDGMTLVPWAAGKSLVWDFTCTNSLANSHINSSAHDPRHAAKTAEAGKHRKYSHLTGPYLFSPVAVECLGSFGPESLRLVKDIGRRIGAATNEPKASAYLLQRISIAIQKGNAACVLGTIPASSSFDEVISLM